ncbi:hypothetical protein [Streptomyces sp. Z26]|uniref:hypothetical protein n=1 Tax=Streptomyces sp. Z26 TaxID=2500177 RepID=UPI000EF1592B|nr:hypothetical protein [Streptomyces sp. Z26]RLL68134.1 hypothetical protein D7M15_16240 [Streptomyces sp. Z26]
MSKPNKKRYILAEVRGQYAEAVGGEDVTFEGPGGVEYTMPHPLFAPKEWKEAVDAADDDEGQARAMLGEEQWATFEAAGGDPTDMVLLNMALREDMQGSLKNGRPTRSSTSSGGTRKR